MLSDRETTLDALGFQPYVESLYSTILSPGITPFTIGIYGKWGTGKTSLMKMLQEKMDKEEKIKTIWFNAWKFEKEKDIWVALIQTLLNEIEIKDNSKIEEAKKIIKKLRHGINWIKMAGFVASIALQKPDFDRLSDALDLNLRDRIESIYDFETEFERLVELSGVDLLVVFIDDLDRCKKGATLNILEVIKLFLYSKKCVYILGLDHEKICKAIENKFPEDVAEEYLDKIVQLPFFIPRIKYENMRKFLRFLVLSQYTKNERDIKDLTEEIHMFREDEFDLKVRKNEIFHLDREQLEEYRDITEQQEIIIRENDHNPRKTKKFLNTYFLRHYMKENLNLELRNEYIVKFLLLQLKHKDFHKDLERYPNILEKIQLLSKIKAEERERELEKSDILGKHFRDRNLMSFLERMEFGDIDPRPYLLLSETGITSMLSIKEIEIIEDLFSNDSIRIFDAINRFSQLEKEKKEYLFSQLEKEKKEYFVRTLLQHARGVLKNNIIDTIAVMGSPAVDPLIALLEKTDNDSLIWRISDTLKKIGDPKAVDPLIALLEKTDNDSLIWRISDVLGTIKDSKAVDPLIALLEKTDNEGLRWKISETLSNIKDVRAVESLITLLDRTDSDDLKKKISDILGKIGDSRAVEPLLILLEKTDNEGLRWKISETLGNIKDVRTVNLLIIFLEKTDSDDLRKRISEALGKIGNNAVEPLITLLDKTDSDDLRKRISEALGKIGNPKAVGPLITLLEKSDNFGLRRKISEALGNTKDPRAVEPLITLLEKTDDIGLRLIILDALVKTGSKAVGPLIDLLEKTNDYSLKMEISEILGRIGDLRAVAPLRDFLEMVDDDHSKEIINNSLNLIKRRNL